MIAAPPTVEEKWMWTTVTSYSICTAAGIKSCSSLLSALQLRTPVASAPSSAGPKISPKRSVG